MENNFNQSNQELELIERRPADNNDVIINFEVANPNTVEDNGDFFRKQNYVFDFKLKYFNFMITFDLLNSQSHLTC